MRIVGGAQCAPAGISDWHCLLLIFNKVGFGLRRLNAPKADL